MKRIVIALSALLAVPAAVTAGDGLARNPERPPVTEATLDLASAYPELVPDSGKNPTITLDRFLAGLPQQADGYRLLTRDSVIRRVLRNHLRIQAAGRRYLAAEAEAEEEAGEFDTSLYGTLVHGESSIPSANTFARPIVGEDRDDRMEVGVRKSFQQGLELSSSFRSSRYETNLEFQGLLPEYDTSLGVTVVQPLLAGAGKASAASDLRAARARAGAQGHYFESEAADVTAGSEILYWRLVGRVEILSMRQDSVDRVRRLRDQTKERLDAGVVPISELRQAESALAGREEDLTRAQREVERVVDTLASNLRLDEDVKVWELPVRTQPLPREAVRVPDLESLVREAKASRQELKGADLEVEAEQVEAVAARKDRKVRLDLVADFELIGLSGGAVEFPNLTPPPDTVVSPFEGNFGDAIDRMLSTDYNDWAVGLEFSYPIGNRGPRARHAREVWEAQESKLGRMRLGDIVRHEVLEAHKDLVASQERARIASRFEELASQALEDEEERLKEGLSNNLRILQLQDDLTEAQTRYILALVEVQESQVMLDRRVGRYLRTRGLDIDDVPLPGELP